MNINQTLIQETLKTFDTVSESIKYLSSELFLPSVIAYWFFQFLLILIIGLSVIKGKGKEKFWAIFFITQLIGLILLFLIFIFPVIPQLIDKII